MGLFTTSWALGIGLIAVAGLAPDQPRGLSAASGLAILGFALFSVSLGHLAFMTADTLFRPMLLVAFALGRIERRFRLSGWQNFGPAKTASPHQPEKDHRRRRRGGRLDDALGRDARPLRLSWHEPGSLGAFAGVGTFDQHSRPVRRPGRLVDQARSGAEGHVDPDSRPRRPARSLRQPVAGRPVPCSTTSTTSNRPASAGTSRRGSSPARFSRRRCRDTPRPGRQADSRASITPNRAQAPSQAP